MLRLMSISSIQQSSLTCSSVADILVPTTTTTTTTTLYITEAKVGEYKYLLIVALY